MKIIFFALVTAGLLIAVGAGVLITKGREESPLARLQARSTKPRAAVVDHSVFPVLAQPFSRPQDVTAACISCHNRRHIEVMESNHWNWERAEYIQGRGIVYLGKKNAINNFCIGARGNERSCAKCHIGYSMSVDGESGTDPTNVDCLVCHDNTETYAKAQEQAGAPDPSVDLSNVARHVGRPQRTNCGICHFYGGGGNNVKHGDLEQAMFEPTRDIDVHMAVEGANLSCVACHTTDRHTIAGKLYSLSSMNRNRATCEQCHGGTPHESDVLNEHTLKVACQTCHISTYAKANATKTAWDWSTAGRLRDGEPYEVDDKDGNHTYLSIKGSFTWGKNLTPDYVWFNGTAVHYLAGDTIHDATKPVVLNRLNGSYSDPESKIIPVKIHRANQPYDPVNRMLIMPKLYAERPGEGAFWQDFSWVRAAEAGMRQAGLPFSGKVDFIATEMYWPINHMVSRKEATVQCTECHTRTNSRLAGLTDFYLPGRDTSPAVEFIGWGMVLLTFLGVVGHSSLRIAAFRRIKRGAE